MFLKTLLILVLLCTVDALTHYDYENMFFEAAKVDDAAALSLTLQQVTDPNVVDADGNTALMWSAWEGHTANVKALLEAGVGIDLQESDGNTALLKACWSGKGEVVQALVAAGADVNKKNFYKLSGLMMASQQGHTHVVRRLLDSGANVKDIDQGGVTALHKACWTGQIEVVKVLIAAGANVKKEQNCRGKRNVVLRTSRKQRASS